MNMLQSYLERAEAMTTDVKIPRTRDSEQDPKNDSGDRNAISDRQLSSGWTLPRFGETYSRY